MPEAPGPGRVPHTRDRCSADLPGRLFLRADDQLRCEACILRLHQRFTDGNDDSLLAESLSAALDLREHETGLHSRRVACHMLVSACRFIEDPPELRQI